MDFERSVASSGNPERVMELALNILAANGFRVVGKGSDFIEFEGSGLNSTRESSVLGASRLRVEADGREVRLRANLGGLRGMRNLLILLPVVLGALFVTLFLWLFHEVDTATVLLLALAPVAPWLVLTPLLMRWIRRRTETALDGLLHNLVTAATPGVLG